MKLINRYNRKVKMQINCVDVHAKIIDEIDSKMDKVGFIFESIS